MNTTSVESMLLSQTGTSLYDFDICAVLLQDALSAACVGNAPKFNSLITLVVELRIDYVLEDLESCELWTWEELDRGEVAYARYERAAVSKLCDLVADCEFLEPAAIRTHMNEIHRFLGALPGEAYETIKKAVMDTAVKALPYTQPRPNDLA